MSSSVCKSPTIVATLCDSRTCHQTGGGENIAQDIEDFLQLVVMAKTQPGNGGTRVDSVKVSLATCMGMCNRAPNMVLKGPMGSKKGGRLRNDGGLRMMVGDADSDDDDTNDDEQTVSPTRGTAPASRSNARNNSTIHEATIPKLARTIGFDHTHLVHACHSQRQGRRCLVAGQYREALRSFGVGVWWCQREEAVAEQGGRLRSIHPTATSQLQASLCLLCAKSRVQLARDAAAGLGATNVPGNEHTKMLELAALQAFRVLDGSCGGGSPDDSRLGIDAVVNGVVAEVMNCAAGKTLHSHLHLGLDEDAAALEAGLGADKNTNDDGIDVVGTMNSNVTGGNNNRTSRVAISAMHPRTTDTKVLVQCCIVLADAWAEIATAISPCKIDDGAIATCVEGETNRGCHVEGARIIYSGILAVAGAPSHKRLRLLPAKERRRVEKVLAGLKFPTR